MNPVALAFAFALPAAFAAGVIFAKNVLSEAAAIKEHVTAEIQEVRADIASALGKAAQKVS